MHSYSPEAAAVIESGERRFIHRLFVDWNNNGRFDHPLSNLSRYVSETTRDQTLTSTAPDEVKLVEGYAAAKLDAIITGEYDGMSLAAHFAPNNGRSIFYTEGIALGVQIGTAASPLVTGVIAAVSLPGAFVVYGVLALIAGALLAVGSRGLR